MSDIDVNIIDDGDINLTLFDDGTINVSLVNGGDLNVTFDGISTFKALSDTPTSYSGQSGKVVTVNSGEDAVEFTSAGSGDVAGPASSTDENIVVFNSTTGKIIKDFGTNISAVTANTAKNTNVSTSLSTGTVNGTSYGITSDGGSDDVVLAQADTTNAGVLSAVKWDEIVANTLKSTNVSTNLSAGTLTATTIAVNSSDGTNATLVEADTTNAGILGSNKWDEIVANTVHSGGDGSDHADVATNTSKVSYTKTNVKGHINHGGTAATARPSGFTSVEWSGTIEPTNSINGDTWIDES